MPVNTNIQCPVNYMQHNRGVSAKGFYLILYSIALRTEQPSPYTHYKTDWIRKLSLYQYST